MYALRASKSPGGWRLTIGKLTGEWNASGDSQQHMGTVKMNLGDVYAPRQEIPQIPEGKLAITIIAPVRKLGAMFPRSEIGDMELHFIFGGTDAFVRLHPDDVPAEATAQN
jgi:hypothetical protein